MSENPELTREEVIEILEVIEVYSANNNEAS